MAAASDDNAPFIELPVVALHSSGIAGD